MNTGSVSSNAWVQSAASHATKRWPSRGLVLVLVTLTVVIATSAGLGALLAREGVFGRHSGGRLVDSSAGPIRLPVPVRCKSCWRPQVKESWQIQLNSTPTPPFLKVGMIEVDGFNTPASVVAAMHRTRPGRGVVCYIDAGTWENWRPDAREFPKSLLGKPDSGWAGERWLDVSRFHGVLGRIMTARVRMCKRKGFNAVDFDNVDEYSNDTGFHLTFDDQLRYDVFLANTAHRLGLSVALKNDLPQIPVLLKYFDFAVNEQCFQYEECLTSQNGGYGLNEFTRVHKAVFEIEYNLKLSRFCPEAIRDHFNSLRKGLNLGPWRQVCG
jgi:endo-alpha-1,4-polygalactosaminidase (GH114 family)